MNSSTIHIYTDGSYDRKTRSCGFGYYVEWGKSTFRRIGGKILGRSHEMEMQAVLSALRFIKKKLGNTKPQQIIIFSDSNSIVQQINNFNMNKTIREDVFGEQNKEWTEIVHFLQEYMVWGEWVKGHAHNIGNNIADELARRGRLTAIKKLAFNLFEDNDRGEVSIDQTEARNKIFSEIQKRREQDLGIFNRKEEEERIKQRVMLRAKKLEEKRKAVRLNESVSILLDVKQEDCVIILNETQQKHDIKNGLSQLKQIFIESNAEKICLGVNDPELFNALSFFQEAILNYQENISFINKKDNEMYNIISNGLKAIKNKKQSLTVSLLS